MNALAPVLLATFGNPMAGDDNFGPLLAALIKGMPIPELDVADLQMRPDLLLERLDGRRGLIIADAALCPDQPFGGIVECDWGAANRPRFAVHRAISSHGMTIIDAVEISRVLGRLPPVVRIVAVNVDRSFGGAVCDCVAAQLTAVRARIEKIVLQVHAGERLVNNPVTSDLRTFR